MTLPSVDPKLAGLVSALLKAIDENSEGLSTICIIKALAHVIEVEASTLLQEVESQEFPE